MTPTIDVLAAALHAAVCDTLVCGPSAHRRDARDILAELPAGWRLVGPGETSNGGDFTIDAEDMTA